MNRQIGLLVMKDENDILEEYLNKITQYYEKIFVLDGSTNNDGKRICERFPEIVFYDKDRNITDKIPNDSIRGFLWEQAKRVCEGYEWVGILHPDEFPDANPLEMLSKHTDASAIAIRNLHFFLHTSQKDTWNFGPGKSIEQMSTWYMAPGWTEYRYFKFDKTFKYGKNHGWVIPENSLNSPIHTSFIHKQYTYRTYDQVLKRARDRWETNWQKNDYCLVLETKDIFFDTLKYPEHFADKYPEQYEKCWYNMPHAYVAKLDD